MNIDFFALLTIDIIKKRQLPSFLELHILLFYDRKSTSRDNFMVYFSIQDINSSHYTKNQNH